MANINPADVRTEPSGHCGIVIRGPAEHGLSATRTSLLAQLDAQDLAHCIITREGTDAAGRYVAFALAGDQAAAWAPNHDTLHLCERLQLDTDKRSADLTREIVLTLLLGPLAHEFPSIDELVSAVRIRHAIVQAARRTTLSFHTSQAERPEDCWAYKEDCGFVILPGASLIAALVKATQPEVSGTLYSFSCYRATEYVMLLGIAQELARCNPLLLGQLQQLWTTRPIKSGQFHDVFLREQGSMAHPMPQHYFAPGDRVWFRNPDAASAGASGYEGSWVIYLGAGLFSNFWKRHQPYTLTAKCLEIYQWRHALYIDTDGQERIDEGKVEALVAAVLPDAAEIERILKLMQHYRAPQGSYDHGGCMDSTREFARWVCPATSDLMLPVN